MKQTANNLSVRSVCSGGGSRHQPSRKASSIRRQCGAIALIFALMLTVLIGFIGMALDLSRVYNRQLELQAIANVAALAAARQLNGTSSGVANAMAEAAVATSALKYEYSQLSIAWDSTALSFSPSPNGGWVDAGTAQNSPAGLNYVRVDTGKLGSAIGTISFTLMPVLSESLKSTEVAGIAVAGRSTIDVAPLAICALSNQEASSRTNSGPPPSVELVEYGFRRGVAYDLMRLNPNGTDAETFVIDPFSPPGVAGKLANVAPELVGPFVCTGQVAMPRVFGGPITVARPFPLDSLFNQFNSRFNLYPNSVCSYATAPPDTNIKSYTFGSGTPWMSVAPAGQGAQETTADGRLRTVADPLPRPAGTTAVMYGPLWTYARAVPFASYVAGAIEPAGGYTPFATTAWNTLYGPVAPTAAASYPSGVSTPYRAGSGGNFQAPPSAHKGVANRRVLNVALLSCPVDTGMIATATVLAIGKFLMTVPATPSHLYGEFGGVVPEKSLNGSVELYP
nr:pilus assembly protein TadG-related protein [uncultured Duganella sp.]